MGADSKIVKPILFSGPMVRAILDGRKTQTRRIIKPQPQLIAGSNDVWQLGDFVAVSTEEMRSHLFHEVYGTKGTPYGALYEDGGDRLWVRETWWPIGEEDAVYRADYLDDPHGPDGEKSPEGKYRLWKPSIHMPRWASRIMLEITDVRVERLQEISEEDAAAEGVEPGCLTCGTNRLYSGGCGYCRPCYRDSFIFLWNSINGKGVRKVLKDGTQQMHSPKRPVVDNSWDANPFVWCLTFKRLNNSS